MNDIVANDVDKLVLVDLDETEKAGICEQLYAQMVGLTE